MGLEGVIHAAPVLARHHRPEHICSDCDLVGVDGVGVLEGVEVCEAVGVIEGVLEGVGVCVGVLVGGIVLVGVGVAFGSTVGVLVGWISTSHALISHVPQLRYSKVKEAQY